MNEITVVLTSEVLKAYQRTASKGGSRAGGWRFGSFGDAVRRAEREAEHRLSRKFPALSSEPRHPNANLSHNPSDPIYHS